jgi:hypothetical protein
VKKIKSVEKIIEKKSIPLEGKCQGHSDRIYLNAPKYPLIDFLLLLFVTEKVVIYRSINASVTHAPNAKWECALRKFLKSINGTVNNNFVRKVIPSNATMHKLINVSVIHKFFALISKLYYSGQSALRDVQMYKLLFHDL